MTAARSDLMALGPANNESTLRGFEADIPAILERLLTGGTISAGCGHHKMAWNEAAGRVELTPSVVRVLLARLAASQPDREAVVLAVKDLHHTANEWADAAINGQQWLRNIVDGISTPAEALENMNSNIAHCVSVRDASMPLSAILSLLSGAGTKSAPPVSASHNSGERVPVSDAALGGADTSPGPDVREAFKSPIKCAACGKMYSDHAPEGDPVCECAARSVRALKEEMDAALTRPLGGEDTKIIYRDGGSTPADLNPINHEQRNRRRK